MDIIQIPSESAYNVKVANSHVSLIQQIGNDESAQSNWTFATVALSVTSFEGCIISSRM